MRTPNMFIICKLLLHLWKRQNDLGIKKKVWLTDFSVYRPALCPRDNAWKFSYIYQKKLSHVNIMK